MRAKDFNRLSAGDRVITALPDELQQAPHNIVALQGKIVVTFREQIAAAQAKTAGESAGTPGAAYCEPIAFYRTEQRGMRQ